MGFKKRMEPFAKEVIYRPKTGFGGPLRLAPFGIK